MTSQYYPKTCGIWTMEEVNIIKGYTTKINYVWRCDAG